MSPVRVAMSLVRDTPTAATCTSASPGEATASVTFSTRSTSGSPKARMTTARIIDQPA